MIVTLLVAFSTYLSTLLCKGMTCSISQLSNKVEVTTLTRSKIRSKYYSPHSFAQFIESKQLQSKISFLHTNIRSLKKNFEEFQHHVLSELNFSFTVIGVSETRICDRECSSNFVPELPEYYFNFRAVFSSISRRLSILSTMRFC